MLQNIIPRVNSLWKTPTEAKQINFVDAGVSERWSWYEDDNVRALHHTEDVDVPIMPLCVDAYQTQLIHFYQPERLLFYVTTLTTESIQSIKQLLLIAASSRGSVEAIVVTASCPDAVKSMLSYSSLRLPQSLDDTDKEGLVSGDIQRSYDWLRLFFEPADVLIVHHPLHTIPILTTSPSHQQQQQQSTTSSSLPSSQCELHMLVSPSLRNITPLTLHRLNR